MSTRCFLCENPKSLPCFSVGSHVFERCAGCGMVYVSNFSSDGTAYKGDEYFVHKNEYVQRWDEFTALFRPLVEKIARWKGQGSFLDVGAGVGTLLHVARQRGFSVTGVEVSEWASAYARDEHGLNVHTGTLQSSAYPAGSFDVIVINHVIEHIAAPLDVLQEARRILKDDGILVIGVPNFGSIMSGLMREKWPSLRPDEHIWHFTPKTLRSMALRAGFREVHFEARENYPVHGWNPSACIRRIINGISVLTDRSEAMLLFANKQ